MLVAGTLQGLFADVGGLDVSDAIILDLNQVDDNIDLISIPLDQPLTTSDDVIIGTASAQDVLLGGEGADILNIASDSGLDELVSYGKIKLMIEADADHGTTLDGVGELLMQ